MNEDWPLFASSDYPRSKIKAETILQEKRGDIPLAILRIAGLYDANCHSIPLAHQIQRIYDRTQTSRLFPGSLYNEHSFILTM